MFLYVVQGEKDKLKTRPTFLHPEYLLYKSCAQLFLRKSVENYRHYTDEGVKIQAAYVTVGHIQRHQFGIEYLYTIMR